jgi:hypothetical protein
VLVGGRTRDSLEDSTTIPGTERSFIGFQLPDWEKAKELALQAADAFPWARSIGWDVAMSGRGPVLIEGNEEWSLRGALSLTRQARRAVYFTSSWIREAISCRCR